MKVSATSGKFRSEVRNAPFTRNAGGIGYNVEHALCRASLHDSPNDCNEGTATMELGQVDGYLLILYHKPEAMG